MTSSPPSPPPPPADVLAEGPPLDEETLESWGLTLSFSLSTKRAGSRAKLFNCMPLFYLCRLTRSLVNTACSLLIDDIGWRAKQVHPRRCLSFHADSRGMGGVPRELLCERMPACTSTRNHASERDKKIARCGAARR